MVLLPESSSISSSVRSERHVDEILKVRGIECERELAGLLEGPVVTPVLVVVVVLNTKPVAPPHIECLAEKTELGTGGDIKKPSTPALPAIGVVIWVVRCLYGRRTSVSKIECVATL